MREHTLQAQPYQGDKHEKAWGHELWIINDEKYCGKLLVFKKDKEFSMHFHLLKDEAWYISKGSFIYKYIDTKPPNTPNTCLLYTSPSPRDRQKSRMPSSA